MFTENKCGCIWSIEQGRVRTCGTHKTEKADGYGGLLNSAPLKGIVRKYPANGQMVYSWNGGK